VPPSSEAPHAAGGTGAPSDNGYTKIYSSDSAFAALKADGSITAWGRSSFGGTGAPSGKGYTKIYSNNGAL
jgi:ribosomal protein S24E